ncbi:MAG: hypothetical protein ACRD8W_28030 [Nitrososphaeraceae archaeon]
MEGGSTRPRCLVKLENYNVFMVFSHTNFMSEEIESAQKNQKKIGSAEDNPDTSGPAENLREEAAEMVDEGEDSQEPA